MSANGSLPTYERLFGELEFREGDEARSVHSPAAYLADLLRLLEDSFERPSLLERRPGLKDVVLDADNTYTEIPYLDIVVEVLEKVVGDDPYGRLRKMEHPFDKPFSLQDERLKAYLEELGVTPAELYRLFAGAAHPDVVARLMLGLTPHEVRLVTTPVTEAELRARYGLQEEELTALRDLARFRRAATLTADELRELLLQNLTPAPRPGPAEARAFYVNQGEGPAGVDEEEDTLVWGDGEPVPLAWYERAHRFVHLARKSSLSFTDLDLVLRSCCGNRIDLPALRVLAAVVHLRRTWDLPVDVVCALAAPMDTVGVRGGADPVGLFGRTFGDPYERALIWPWPDQLPAGREVLACRGDILAARNAEYRRRVAHALAEPDVAEIVTRFRAKYAATPHETAPFDGPAVGLAELSLLHRVGVLTSALGMSAAELFDVLDVLDADPAPRPYGSFPPPVDTGAGTRDCYRTLAGGDPAASLWLAQTLAAVAEWLRATGLGPMSLREMLGGTPGEDAGEHATALAGDLSSRLEPFGPEVLASDRFGERAAEVVYDVLTAYDGVVCPQDDRVLRLERSIAKAAAHDALTDLAVVTEEDFAGLGLGERLAAKIHANLVTAGYLRPDGTMETTALPQEAAGLRLAGDFTPHRPALYTLITRLRQDAAGPPALYPSDLASLGTTMTAAEQTELYDNLIYNGCLDEDGQILFTGDEAALAVNADLGGAAPAAFEALHERVRRFRQDRLTLDPDVFAALPLTPDQVETLVEGLRFNGWLDADGDYADKAALAGLKADDLALPPEFHPYRQGVLDAMKAQIEEFRSELFAFSAEDFEDLAEAVAGRRVLDRLADLCAEDGRLPGDAVRHLAGEAPLGDGFTAAEQEIVAARVAAVVREAKPYRLDLEAVAELGFDPGESVRLVERLVAAGDLDGTLAVPAGRLAFFGNPGNTLGYALPGLEDYAKDVFFLLHRVAVELAAGIAEIVETLSGLAERQSGELAAVLEDALGVPADTALAICAGVTGTPTSTPTGALETFVVPALAAADLADETGEDLAAPADPRFRHAHRRVRAFAALAARLGLDAAEVEAAFRDQDLAGGFPEPLALPPGLDRFDALLESADGHVYLFREQHYWTYSADAYVLADQKGKPLKELSPRFEQLSGVDAAFTASDGLEWIIGRDRDGLSRAFTRTPGSLRWVPKEQVWGKVRSMFTDPVRIDGAFVDADGRTYLFCGDQYVRYSGPGYATVDEGYPRAIGRWWEGEGRTPLPEPFRTVVDAGFQDRDGRIHLFSGDRAFTVGDTADRPIAGTWGRIRNELADGGRVDAAYADTSGTYLFSRDQVMAYTDGLEGEGVNADDEYPKRIGTRFPGLPVEFESGVEAAFADGDGVVHLFKDGRTVAVGDAAGAVPTLRRWGIVEEVLPGGAVDAAFVGMDGRTYLFGGERYLRYSTADYSVADSGYPRRVEDDWGGLRRVDAAFVMDRQTYLFGTGGKLLDLPVEHLADLEAGQVTAVLRRRLLEHGLPVAEEARIEGAAPQWRLATEQGVRLVIVYEAGLLTVRCDPAEQAPFYARYSTADYTTPDPGFPRPVGDGWWNLPAEDGFTTVDAVFTGRDGRTYVFSGSHYVASDDRRRWWTEPRPLRGLWGSLPFGQVDAAFVGKDGKTYVFGDGSYVRYSTADYSRVDDRYPAPVKPFWGNVANAIARTGKVDAALVADSTETVNGVEVTRTHTYLFSGGQYVRYEGHDYTRVQDGYPRAVSALAQEPRLRNLHLTLDGPIDAVCADRRNVFLFEGGRCHVVSDTLYRHYTHLDLAGVTCAFVEDGSVLVQREDGWWRHGALEGLAPGQTPVRPRTLRQVPAAFHDQLDAVLKGADGNTYLFKGASCYNVTLGREYPLAEEWGRPHDTIHHGNTVDAAFVGRDGKTYLFSGDQFVAHTAPGQLDGVPRPIAAHWAGLTSVALAYVRDGGTYVFEKPGPDGRMRYLVYSGADYAAPAETGTADAGFWGIPQVYRDEGFGVPDAVLFAGGAMVLLHGERCLQYTEATRQWSPPRPAERLWPGLGHDRAPGEVFKTAFTATDGATYFFFSHQFTRYFDGTFTPMAPVRQWTGSHGIDRVDAAVVTGEHTFLFCGDRYVRYTGSEYRYADPGYPRPIAAELRKEEAFANLGETFDDVILDGTGRRIQAALADRRTVFLLAGGGCHAVSRTAATTYELAGVAGRVRNAVAAGRVDAALVTDTATFLFAGDQYVRYSGPGQDLADEGYPRTIAAGLPAELGRPALPLPEDFQDGIDAAFRGPDGHVYLFRNRQWLRADEGVPRPVPGTWGVVDNAFDPARPRVDAAFTAPTGELYAFTGGQYVRYRPGALEYVEEGYPRSIKDAWGDLPSGFEEGIDGAFVFEGRTYLAKGDRYVREGAAAQPFRPRWSGAADYRLDDMAAIGRLALLVRSAPGGTGGFLTEVVADPYRRLHELFGWDPEEVRWVRRHEGPPSDRFEIEFLLRLAGLFAVTGRMGTVPSLAYGSIWAPLHDPSPETVAPAVSDTLHALLARRTGPQDWPALERRLHDRLNTAKRDALVSAVLAGRPELPTSRELYEHLFIDVDMGGQGTSSRVREAIAAVQLFLHRYLLGAEAAAPREGLTDEAVRERLRAWWEWMSAYRIWEANRKIFLYPENYVRPELRDTKTPAFRELEADLLRGEITPDVVQRAYKRYLDEYTEVSRLAIAGGYVYRPDEEEKDTRRLVLFGRTRTEPRRHYYRRAEFRDGDGLSATWGPWLKVDTQIDAERVHPVHAFGRVFVFWAVVEKAAPADATGTTITTKPGTAAGSQTVSATPPDHRVRILYSFLNLNGEWSPAQLLATTPEQSEPITNAELYVQASRIVPGGTQDAHDSIVVTCTYKPDDPEPPAYALTPELYVVEATGVRKPASTARLDTIFQEPVDESAAVPFNMPAGTTDGPWLSVDHKGGSFLCRRVTPDDSLEVPIRRVDGKAHLPKSWARIDAAVELPTKDRLRYYFSGTGFVSAPAEQDPVEDPAEPIGNRWGIVRTGLLDKGAVDATFTLRTSNRVVTYVFSGTEYYRYTRADNVLGKLDSGYPRQIAANGDDLPAWTKVDAAFTHRGKNVLISLARGTYVELPDLTEHDLAGRWKLPAGVLPDGIAAFGDDVLLFSGNKYYLLGTGDPAEHTLGDVAGMPKQGPVNAVLAYDSGHYFFDNTSATCTYLKGEAPPQTRDSKELGLVRTVMVTDEGVDAAYVEGDKLYLTREQELYRYTLRDGLPGRYLDDGYPLKLEHKVKAVFRRGGRRYVFSGADYTILPEGKELAAGLATSPVLTWKPIAGNWGGLTSWFARDFTGVLDAGDNLYVFLNRHYATYPSDAAVQRPFEYAGLPYEIVRLTSSTAYRLNEKLLTGGVAALLAPQTQETDELPAFSRTVSNTTTIKVGSRYEVTAMPTSSHLDFPSANGGYYWEIFFHAPLLIAQALNGAQRFKDARAWYEYVFDPAEPVAYWRFLPFLTLDVRALAANCAADLAGLRRLGVGLTDLADLLQPMLERLTELAAAFQNRTLTGEDLSDLAGMAAADLAPAFDAVTGAGNPEAAAVLRGLRERAAMIGGLRRQYDLMGDHGRQLDAYRDDPFDPHAIAELRPAAYRRAVVMAYIDNLLDWGDLLFRQYTAESIDEARMVYIHAYDLLGARPEGLGLRPLPEARGYAGINRVDAVTGGGQLLTGKGAVHEGVADPYFHIPDNALFTGYWNRVEDRLRKIRQSLTILGVSRPVPLFEPPIDPMELVRGAASGTGVEAVAATQAVVVPQHRFWFLFRRAQDLVDKLRQFAGDLLGALERRDAEELALLQARQEGVILAMTRGVREAQVRAATANLHEAQAGREAVSTRAQHYEQLIADGLSALQLDQLRLMQDAANSHLAAAGLKIGAAIAYAAPQILAGPFIMGTEFGGDQIGAALDKGAEISESLGEGLSMLGELTGIRAENERSAQDWRFQLDTARHDLLQADQQVAGAEHGLALARRELEVHDQEIAHQQAVAAFVRGKFGGADLYSWLSDRLAGLYFQAYGLAHDMARAAERAYQFERGAEQTSFIRPAYWDSRRAGLLAGESLGMDLERLAQAYVEADGRDLEIVKQVPLTGLDPVALLTLKYTGTCDFALTEAVFDRDFPGHYRRQIKTVFLAFEGPDGRLTPNATLTQLGHKTVLAADAKAIKHLLEPKGAAPGTVRADWRAGQRIALSHVEEGEDGSGLFEVRYDDDRYLPFEGTGAVSTWRLELSGRPPADLREVVITVKYAARHGGDPFASAVKGMLKPFAAARFIDVARDFPEQWEEFQATGGQLALPVDASLFPGMNGGQITGVRPAYEGQGAIHVTLAAGNRAFALRDGTYVTTPGLTAGDWVLEVDGDASGLRNVGLVLTYKSNVR
ncbi:hemopexin repeat-containing protein [Nonomuraea guangzhouensis]|uniref:Hemopexin repeat-containing protein n=1 Tax=Nonomuraea guangzhouensis TaxID=1291555 RepID=A0ABW4GSY7_9ACTN